MRKSWQVRGCEHSEQHFSGAGVVGIAVEFEEVDHVGRDDIEGVFVGLSKSSK